MHIYAHSYIRTYTHISTCTRHNDLLNYFYFTEALPSIANSTVNPGPG